MWESIRNKTLEYKSLARRDPGGQTKREQLFMKGFGTGKV
jgi:hypothetical protein